MIRVAIVGAGAIARAHADALAASPHFNLVAVVDVDAARAAALAAKFGARSATNLKALTDGSIGAAIVSTPPNTHRAVTTALLEAGVHVLCEKPFAIGRNNAYAMAETAKRCSRVLTMATKFRFVNDLTIARDAIAAGKIGTLYRVSNTFASPVDMTGRWNLDPQASGGGVIIDNGTHSVDIVRYLLGPIESIAAEEGPRPHGLAVDENVHLSLVCAGGVPASIDLSWTEQSQSPYYIEINGTRGRIGIGWKESVYTLANDGVLRPFGPGYDKIAAFAGQLRNVVDVLCGNATVEVGHADALASVAAISSAYEALRSGRAVAVERAPLHARSGLAVVS